MSSFAAICCTSRVGVPGVHFFNIFFCSAVVSDSVVIMAEEIEVAEESSELKKLFLRIFQPALEKQPA